MEKIRDTSAVSDEFFSLCINFPGGNAGRNHGFQLLMHMSKALSGLPHQFDFSCRFN